MIRAINNAPIKHIEWKAKAGGVRKGNLVKEDTGATPVAAEHTGATILGVALETQLTTGGLVKLFPMKGTVLEIDIKSDATKQAFETADLGKSYDLVAVSNEHFVDSDKTADGFLVLIGFDNFAKKGYFAVADAITLLNY